MTEDVEAIAATTNRYPTNLVPVFHHPCGRRTTGYAPHHCVTCDTVRAHLVSKEKSDGL